MLYSKRIFENSTLKLFSELTLYIEQFFLKFNAEVFIKSRPVYEIDFSKYNPETFFDIHLIF